MPAYYCEIDDYAAEWLRNLMDEGEIARGRTDERSIADVQGQDLEGYEQFHAFAGIGVWSAALRDAGWPDDCEVWTGSCPCQPFSQAGRRRGTGDERHLWPAWWRLIHERRPAVVLGEQVASKDGRAWLDLVLADLEGSGYTGRALDLPAAGVGAPHARQRLYITAVLPGPGLDRVRDRLRAARAREPANDDVQRREGERIRVLGRGPHQGRVEVGGRGEAGDGPVSLADTERDHGSGRVAEPHGRSSVEPHRHSATCGTVAHSERVLTARLGGPGSPLEPDPHRAPGEPVGDAGLARGRRDAGLARGRRDAGTVPGAQGGREGERGEPGRVADVALAPGPDRDPGYTRGFWNPCDWVPCRDGKVRPVEPGAFPLADGSPECVVEGGAVETQPRSRTLRGYGNAIVRPLAAEFVRAVMDCLVGD